MKSSYTIGSQKNQTFARLFILAIFCLTILNLTAQVFNEDFQIKQNPYFYHNMDGYGAAMDVHENFAVIGAFEHNNSGCAYVLENVDNKWEFIAQLSPSPTSGPTTENKQFGVDVAITENLIAVTATFGFGKQSAVYVFEKPENGWVNTTETAVMFPPEISNRSLWSKVDAFENTIVVAENSYNNNGKLYVYEKPESGWQTMQSTAALTASDIEIDDYFGNEIAITENTIITSSFNKTVNNEIKGVIYFFEKPEEGWENTTESSKFTVPDENKVKYLGKSMCVHNNKLVVTACVDYKHMLYFFEKSNNNWLKTDELFVELFSSAEPNNTGWNVALNENEVSTISKSNLGRCAFLYSKTDNSWENSTPIELYASYEDFTYNGWKSMGFAGNSLFIGSGRHNGSENGGLLVFEKDADGWKSKYNDSLLNPSYIIEQGDGYGQSIAINGEYAAIGTPYYKIFGCVYILKKVDNNWETLARLTPSDSTERGFFGSTVCMNDSMVFVGNGDIYIHDRVYAFKKPETGWKNSNESFCLFASNYESNYAFGASMALDSNILAIGSVANYSNESSLGNVYIFENPGVEIKDTTENAILTKADGYYYDIFGKTIALKGDLLVAGGMQESNRANSAGAIYIYEKPENGWKDTVESAKITRNRGVDFDQFGRSISISDNTILVAANDSIYNGTPLGAVFVCEKQNNQWVNASDENKISPKNINIRYFANSFSIIADTLYASAANYENEEQKKHFVYKYIKQNNQWAEATSTVELAPKDYTQSSGYNSTISASNNYLFINSTLQGMVYGYNIPFTNIDSSSIVSIPKQHCIADDQNIFLYPNPSKGWVNVTVKNADLSEIKVYNSMGQCVMLKQQVNSQVTLNLSDFDKGIYFIEIQTEQENYLEKIILN